MTGICRLNATFITLLVLGDPDGESPYPWAALI
jgi:hypothetical protein